MITSIANKEGETAIKANYSMDKEKIIWFVNDNYLEVSSLGIDRSSVIWDVLSRNVYDNMDKDAQVDFYGGLVIASLGYNDEAMPIKPISCGDIMSDENFLDRYDHAQILRVRLIQMA